MGKMVSCAGELFRRGLGDETIRTGKGSNFNECKREAGGREASSDLAPLAGGGRIRAIERIRVRGTYRTRFISAFAGRASHPNPLPARARAGRGSNSAPSRFLFPGGREQVSAASDGADHGRLGRVRFDLAPDSHDPQVAGAVEGFAVARVGQFQEALPR